MFMRGFLLFVTVFFLVSSVHSQKFSAKDFLFASSLSSKKFEAYLNKKKFFSSGSRSDNGNLIHIYSLKPGKNKKDTLKIRKTIETGHTKNNFTFTYITSLKNEFTGSLKSLKESGFFCSNENDADSIFF